MVNNSKTKQGEERSKTKFGRKAMGNNLCRERIARADNSKNPIDRIIGRCAQICPANEVKPNYWQKHVLQTGPPTRTQPHSAFNDGWRKVTLTVPNGKTNTESDFGETPIAPPRRKRSAVVDRQPVGFKELFGSNVSRRSSCDSILKAENLAPLSEREQDLLQQKRKSKSISDFNLNEIKTTDSLSISTIRIPVTRTLSLMERAMVQQTTIPAPRPALQRKISRVGNKKSDKFFGENLSDCLSDDPITPEPEPTSISFTYHTISTLITPIPHSQCADVKDKLDEFVNVNVAPANDIDSNRTVYTSCIEPNETSKPFTVSECVDARQNGNRKSSLDKKAEFLMAMLEGTNVLAASTPTEENNKVITPPRRSHLKKKQHLPSNETNISNSTKESATIAQNNAISSHTKSNAPQHNPEKPIEKRSVDVNNKEFGTKNETNVNIVNSAGIDGDEMYRGMTPVEQPLVVPRRRINNDVNQNHHIKKQIDTYSHPSNASNQNENKENQPNSSTSNDKLIEQYIISKVTQSSPEKPKRDFSSMNERSNKKPDEHSAPATPNPVPVTRVRHLSHDSLIPKTALAPTVGGTDPLESVLKRYTSQQSFFTQDLLNQLSDRIYGFQDDPFDPTGTCDDGTGKYTSNSKLTTRKASVHRKESTVTRPILENEAFDDAPKIIQMEEKEPKLIDAVVSSSPNGDNKMDEKPSAEIITQQPKSTIEQFILAERDNSSVCDEKIDAVTEQKQETITIATTNSLHDCHKINGGKMSDAPLANSEDTSLEASTSSEDDNTDSDTTVKTQLNNNIDALAKTFDDSAKGDGIVDVDAWFLRHNDLTSNSRRSSESQITYDTRKVFPFGKSEPGAGSAFFDTKTLSKSAEHVLNDNKLTIFETATTPTINPNEVTTNEIPISASTNDHSILLKYLK